MTPRDFAKFYVKNASSTYYSPEIAQALGSGINSILLINLAKKWYEHEQPFAQWAYPIKHELYIKGNSLCENLGLRVNEVKWSLNKITFNVKSYEEARQKFVHSCIPSWSEVDEGNGLVTRQLRISNMLLAHWIDHVGVNRYCLNTALFEGMLVDIYGNNEPAKPNKPESFSSMNSILAPMYEQYAKVNKPKQKTNNTFEVPDRLE